MQELIAALEQAEARIKRYTLLACKLRHRLVIKTRRERYKHRWYLMRNDRLAAQVEKSQAMLHRAAWAEALEKK